MRVRAIKDLTQLGDRVFFPTVAEGLDLIVRNVTRLRGRAVTLAEASQAHAAGLLAMLAEEEAAKFLILLDAVRCPRLPPERLARQLARFNDHLAKGLYASVCGMRPVTLAQLQEYVNNDREDLYLDGPTGVDWIFRNQVIQDREGMIYVDYVAHEDQHTWSDPAQFEDNLCSMPPEPWAVTTVLHLSEVGVATADALAVVAEVWRARVPAPETHCGQITELNHLTLQALDARGLLRERPDAAYAWIIRQWQFPMYDLDLTEIKVDREALRERQRNWSPDFC